MIINKEKNFASVVVYSYNCEKYVGEFLKKVNKLFHDNFEHYEIIFVDDKSTDNSVKVIKEEAQNTKDTVISVINMSSYQGMELSMNAGVDLAIGDFIFEFDTTIIDYDLDVIMEVYRKCLEGNDIVCATSDKKKRLTSRIFYKIFNKNTNGIYKITTETFRLISRRAINRVKEVNKTIPYRKAVYANCGLKKDEIKYKSTINKNSNLTKEVNQFRKEVAVDSLILFTNIAYKFAITLALVMMISLIITAIYTIIVFIGGTPIAGWTTIMLLLSFAFFGIFSILTIMIKYLSILIDLIFKKQNYLVESIEKITK